MSGVWGADIISLKSTDDSDVYTFFRYTARASPESGFETVLFCE